MAKKVPERARKKRDLYKLIVARSDIVAARHAAVLLVDRVKHLGDDLYAPLYYAAAISYARPFTDNRPYGPLPGTWRRFADPRLQRMHDSLIRTRNEFIAHSDFARRTVHIVPPGATFGPPNLVSARVSVVVSLSYVALEAFPVVVETCQDLGERINVAVEDLLTELFEGRALPGAAFPLTPNDDL
jgi:hypothetical protein